MCAEISHGKSYADFDVVEDVYDGNAEEDLRRLRDQTEGDPFARRALLGDRRLLRDDRESKYTPNDCCIYCAWQTASLAISFPEKLAELAEFVFLGRLRPNSALPASLFAQPPSESRRKVGKRTRRRRHTLKDDQRTASVTKNKGTAAMAANNKRSSLPACFERFRQMAETAQQSTKNAEEEEGERAAAPNN